MELSERELKVMEYLSGCLEKNGFAPSVRDIQRDCGIKSTSTVHLILKKLENAGEIKKQQGKSRSLTLSRSAVRSDKKIPLVGKVAAGLPILAEENIEDYVEFPFSDPEFRYKSFFALRVRGDSMTGAGIFDGDILIVEKTDYAENGNIVIAGVGDGASFEATCKRFFRENGRFRLQPENKSMAPIFCENVFILGIVRASVRRFT